ncbi:unnamed protein product [Gadus morhua 'NCC']
MPRVVVPQAADGPRDTALDTSPPEPPETTRDRESWGRWGSVSLQKTCQLSVRLRSLGEAWLLHQYCLHQLLCNSCRLEAARSSPVKLTPCSSPLSACHHLVQVT